MNQKTDHSITKRWILSIFLLLLILPLIQFTLPFTKETPLDGVDPAPKLPTFSAETWFNEEYQKIYQPLFEQNIGFHNSLVRLHNQINYTIFKYSDVSDVVVGKDNFVFLKPYINAVSGADFVGTEYISIQAEKIKVIQTELKKKNIDFFVILAPGKGSFYSEYIPSHYFRKTITDSTNYAGYKKMFAVNNVNCLDLRAHFSSIKSSEKYPLYSNTGVHWSRYCCYLAGKEIVKYTEELRNIKLPEIKLESVKMLSLTGKNSNDYDAASLMNVASTIAQPELAFPKLTYVSNDKTIKPRFLCIADSYFEGIAKTNIPQNVFTNYHYWLYNNREFPASYLKDKMVNTLDFKKEIEKHQVVCILATDASLSIFPFGFVDKAYEIYATKDHAYALLKNKEYHCFITKTMVNISNNKEWKLQLIESAKRKKISPIYEYIDAANWLYAEEQKKIKGE
ncbi:sugar O-acetyltransferase [soil metagenome]